MRPGTGGMGLSCATSHGASGYDRPISRSGLLTATELVLYFRLSSLVPYVGPGEHVWLTFRDDSVDGHSVHTFACIIDCILPDGLPCVWHVFIGHR